MHSAAGAVACDFNEDGWVDLAVGYHKVDNDHLGHSGVWWNGPEGFSATRTTLLPTEGPHGLVRVGASNLADGGPEEYYTSAPFLLPEGAVLDHLEWEATVPPKCWVRAQVRSAASRRPCKAPRGRARRAREAGTSAVGRSHLTTPPSDGCNTGSRWARATAAAPPGSPRSAWPGATGQSDPPHPLDLLGSSWRGDRDHLSFLERLEGGEGNRPGHVGIQDAPLRVVALLQALQEVRE